MGKLFLGAATGLELIDETSLLVAPSCRCLCKDWRLMETGTV